MMCNRSLCGAVPRRAGTECSHSHLGCFYDSMPNSFGMNDVKNLYTVYMDIATNASSRNNREGF